MKDCDDICLDEEESDTELAETGDIKSFNSMASAKGKKGKSKVANEPVSEKTIKKPARAKGSTRPKKGRPTSEPAHTPSTTDTGAQSSLRKSAFIAPHPPTTIDELPTTIADLEILLPSLCVPQAVDAVEAEMEDEIATLSLAERPDMLKYLQLHLAILKTHMTAVTIDDDSDVRTQLAIRKKALQWYIRHYQRLLVPAQSPQRNAHIPDLTLSAAQPVIDARMDVDIDNAIASFGKP